MEFIKALFSGEMGSMAQVVSILILCNGVLSGLRQILDSIKDKTSTSLDNKAAAILSSALGWSSKAIDYIQGNVAHKK